MNTAPIALITGGSRGIGLELIQTFSRHGYHIITTTTHSDGKATILEHLPEAEVILWNALHDNTDVITQYFKSSARSPDVFIYNAGMTRDQLAIRLSPAHWHDVYRVNTDAAAQLAIWALRAMMSTSCNGCIIFLSSVVAHTGNQGQANYIASKAALEGLTRALATEGGPRGIRVNCIAPGLIHTAMTSGLSDAQRTDALSRIPLGRMGSTSDVAECAWYLTQAHYVTGQILHVNGGMFFGG